MGVTLALAVKGLCEQQRRLAVGIVHSHYFTDEGTEVQSSVVTCSNPLSKFVLSQALLPGLLIGSPQE